VEKHHKGKTRGSKKFQVTTRSPKVKFSCSSIKGEGTKEKAEKRKGGWFENLLLQDRNPKNQVKKKNGTVTEDTVKDRITLGGGEKKE